MFNLQMTNIKQTWNDYNQIYHNDVSAWQISHSHTLYENTHPHPTFLLASQGLIYWILGILPLAYWYVANQALKKTL